MGSPVTLSGFNNIDFGSVLNALMQQERIPVTQLESQQTALKAQQTAFGTFATRLAALESAAEDLTRATAFQGRSASVSNTSALTASTGTLDAGRQLRDLRQRARPRPGHRHDQHARRQGHDHRRLRRLARDRRHDRHDHRRRHAAGTGRGDQQHDGHRSDGVGRPERRELPARADRQRDRRGQRLHDHRQPDRRHGGRGVRPGHRTARH